MKVYLVKYCIAYECECGEVQSAYLDKAEAERVCAEMNESNPHDSEWYEIQEVEAV